VIITIIYLLYNLVFHVYIYIYIYIYIKQLKNLDPERFDKEYLKLFTNVKEITIDKPKDQHEKNKDEIDDETKSKMFQLLTEKINGIDLDNHSFNTKIIADRLFESWNNPDFNNSFKVVWMVMYTKMSHSSLLAKKIFDTCIELGNKLK